MPDIFDAHHRSPDRASSQTVAEPVGLSQARKAAGAADRHSSSLRTPEIPNFISRRRLGALKDLSPTQHSKDSPTQHSKDSRPAADVVAATSHATSHAEERPVQHASMVDMQPDHPVQLSHPNRSLKSLLLSGCGGGLRSRAVARGREGGGERATIMKSPRMQQHPMSGSAHILWPTLIRAY